MLVVFLSREKVFERWEVRHFRIPSSPVHFEPLVLSVMVLPPPPPFCLGELSGEPSLWGASSSTTKTLECVPPNSVKSDTLTLLPRERVSGPRAIHLHRAVFSMEAVLVSPQLAWSGVRVFVTVLPNWLRLGSSTKIPKYWRENTRSFSDLVDYGFFPLELVFPPLIFFSHGKPVRSLTHVSRYMPPIL